jgi:membrane protein DedA with SNARE-associated domain
MPWWRFLIANVIGAALWTAAWGLGPYVIGKAAKPVIQHIKSEHKKSSLSNDNRTLRYAIVYQSPMVA